MAGVAGGMLASAVLKVVVNQIAGVIGGQIKMQKNFKQDLDHMKMMLETLAAATEDAERQSIETRSRNVWLKRLKSAMYDISDMLDEWEADTQSDAPKKSFKKFILQLASIGPKIELANNMKTMREELKVIEDQHKGFSLEAGSARNEQKLPDMRETSGVMNDEELIIGRTDEHVKIMSSLTENLREKFVIFPIYGIGGIGKTTMVKMIFNHALFNEYSRVWVYVSQMFDLNKIGNSIISQLSKTESQITVKQMILVRLAELLAGKHILIVLDDLWEDNAEFQLDELKSMLKVSDKASKIMVIVTSRNEDIANNLHTIKPYKLPLLSDDSCWSIIKQKSKLDLGSGKKQLEEIGRDIARKCGGVALAAKVVGHMLQNKNPHVWESVRKSNIWNVSTSKGTDPVISSLRLTYSHMPSHLRLCFAYCAIFPKGQNMVKDDLVHQWISLGFIDKTHEFTTRQQIGEEYITQLLGLSFLEHPAVGVYKKDVKHLTMHDLVHDLAQLVLADEIILGVSKVGNTEGTSCRYALFDDCSKKLESYTDSLSKIRTLRFLGCGKIGVHGNAFSSAKHLRVLDLSECFIHKLPDSVGQLKQLRYLNAPKIQNWMIPNCITKLLKLMYLNFSGSAALLELPDSIGEMENLMHLNLSGCSGLEKLPESFAKLKKLVHLDLSHSTNVTGASESLKSLTNLEYLDLAYCWNIRELPEHFGRLLKLKYFNMSGCDEIKELPGSFGNLKNLVHLDLSHCYQVKVIPEVLGNLTKLQHLNLSNCGCIGGTNVAEAMGNLIELRYLNLSGFMDKMCQDESTMSTSLECISTLSNLEHLDISCNVEIICLPECIDSLSKLHTLDLSDCSSLRFLPESICQMQSLKMIYWKDCSPLINLLLVRCGLYKSLDTLPCFISGLSIRKFMAHADELKGSSLALFLAMDVTELTISGLEVAKSVEEEQNIQLVVKWSGSYNERVVEDNKVLGGLLEKFPDWLMGISRNSFPNLVNISLKGLTNCISLPPLGQLLNLETLELRRMPCVAKIDEDFCGGTEAFPRLETFTLCKMENLQVWKTTNSFGGYMFPSLRNLAINDCPKLSLKPCPPKAEVWTIRGSDGVISSWGENMSGTGASTASSALVTTLTIFDCKLPMHHWRLLHHLPALPELHIMLCEDLTSSPEIIKTLSSLQHLSVIWSMRNRSRGQQLEWLGHLTSLEKLEVSYFHVDALQDMTKHPSSLQSLEIGNCDSMITLPLWVGDLRSLKRMKISCCINLNNLPEVMGSLTSLQELEIRECPRIQSLPESIQHLTRLQKLEIIECTALQQWCEAEENKMKLAHIKEKTISD